MSWDTVFGALIMLVGVLIGYAIANTKPPTTTMPTIINTSDWSKGNDGIGSGTES